MMLMWFPLLVLVPLAVVWAVRPEALEGRADRGSPSGHGEAREIARQRLARGDITPAQHSEIMAAIR
jgi:uncharacterized membrane protein